MVKITTVSKRIDQNLRKVRKRKAITQEQLALDAELNRAYIGYIERGERNPSTDTLVKIAKALKASLSELFSNL